MDKKLSYEELMALYIKEHNEKIDLKNENSDLKGKIINKDNEINTLEKKNDTLEEKNNILEKKNDTLEEKNNILEKKNDELEKKKDILEKENYELRLEVQELLKQIERKEIVNKKYRIEKFGIKSDKRETIIANDIEVNSKIKFKEETKDKKKPGRKSGTLDASKFDLSLIETKEVIIDNDNKICDICGHELIYTKDDIKYKVDIIPSKVVLTKYIIKKYECSYCDNKEKIENINTFDNESFLTPSLSSFIVNNKFNYALPIYRIEQILKQLGAPLNRQLLSSYAIKTAEKLEPIYNLLKENLLKTNIKVLHADETPLKVIKNKDRCKSYIWLYATTLYDYPTYIYEYQESREAKHPKNFLTNYNGYLVCDDYNGYNNINNVKLSRCWFHAKKKYADFIKTLTDKQKETSQAVVIHDKISNIFKEENKIQERKLTPNEIKIERERILRPLINEYFEYILKLSNEVDESSELYKAIKYSLNIKDDLCRFFDDGHIPLTNNLSERGIKPFVILRKNCLFCYTENGAEASTLLMSIVQTAKMNLLKPDLYIKYVLENIDDTKLSEIDNLLPTNKNLPEYLYYSKKDLA